MTASINNKLESSIFKTNLEKLGLQDPIDTVQDGLDSLSAALNASFVLYAIGVGASGLLILLSLVMLFKPSTILSLLAIATAGIGFLALMLASIVITIVQNKTVETINDKGKKVGLEAYKGGKYHSLTWTSVAVLFIAFIVLIVGWFKDRKQRKSAKAAEFPEK